MKKLFLLILLVCLPAAAQVPVSLMPVVKQQFFSASGVPLAGGFVYTYLTGTSTPAPTYSDSTGLYVNSNPIVLDGGGRAQIWIPATAIDVAVADQNNVQQYKVLNVTALGPTIGLLTVGTIVSSSVNPALSGFLRMENTDKECWRNSGNSADICFGLGNTSTGTDFPILFGTSNFDFAFLNIAQTWTEPQQFQHLSWTADSSFPYPATLTHTNTGLRTYTFPDISGTVCLDTFCSLTMPIFNGAQIGNAIQGYTVFTGNTITKYAGNNLSVSSPFHGIPSELTAADLGPIASCSTQSPNTIRTGSSSARYFRFNYYLATRNTGSAGTYVLTLTWTDDSGNSRTFTGQNVDLTSATSFDENSVTFLLGNGSNVAYTLTNSSGAGSPTCSFFYNLETY